MKGPALLTMLMFLALALVAYAQAAPRAGHREAKGLLSRTPIAGSCPLGSHYSSFYHGCALTKTASPK